MPGDRTAEEWGIFRKVLKDDILDTTDSHTSAITVQNHHFNSKWVLMVLDSQSINH